MYWKISSHPHDLFLFTNMQRLCHGDFKENINILLDVDEYKYYISKKLYLYHIVPDITNDAPVATKNKSANLSLLRKNGRIQK